MKKLATLFFLVPIVLVAQEKKLINLLNKGDVKALDAYYAKDQNYDEYINLEVEIYDDIVTYEVHPLVYVTGKNNLTLVHYYLQKFEEISEGQTELYEDIIGEAFAVSISRRNEEISDLLYSKSPNIKATCAPCNDANALFIAAAYGNEKWYFKLKEGSDLTLKNSLGNNLLHAAASGGSPKIVQDVLSLNLFDINSKNNDFFNDTPLNLSMKHESEEVFNLLIEAGADINISEYLWFSAIEIVNQQIWDYVSTKASAALLFSITETGELPLHYALSTDKTNIAVWMMTQMKGQCNNESQVITEAFYMNEYDPILYTIEFENQRAFEAFIDFSAHMNTCVSDYQMIPIYTYVRKRAAKVFGKAYVEELYQKYGVQEIKEL
jgi:ankyrin repeat protein